MFVGTFGAINQNKIKRLFAYSSIAHVGYLLIGLSTGTIEAVESLLLYIIIYIFMIINVFGILLIMAKEDFHVGQTGVCDTNFSFLIDPAPNIQRAQRDQRKT
jgi:NADH:ubiquinone oxidoreductase subunit 2 (subunit N)